MTGAAAAAETPRRSSNFFTRAAASSSDRPTIDSSNCCRSAIFLSTYSLFVVLISFPSLRFPMCRSARQTTPGDHPSQRITQSFLEAFAPKPLSRPVERRFSRVPHPSRLCLGGSNKPKPAPGAPSSSPDFAERVGNQNYADASAGAASAAGAASTGAGAPPNLFFSTPWLMTTARSRPTAFITVTRRCAGAVIRKSSFE